MQVASAAKVAATKADEAIRAMAAELLDFDARVKALETEKEQAGWNGNHRQVGFLSCFPPPFGKRTAPCRCCLYALVSHIILARA